MLDHADLTRLLEIDVKICEQNFKKATDTAGSEKRLGTLKVDYSKLITRMNKLVEDFVHAESNNFYGAGGGLHLDATIEDLHELNFTK